MNNRDPWPADKSDWAGDAQMLGQSVCRFESLSTAPTAEKGEDLRIAKRWNVENAVSKGIRFTWDTSCCGALGCLHGQFSHHTGHKFSWEASRASSCASSTDRQTDSLQLGHPEGLLELAHVHRCLPMVTIAAKRLSMVTTAAKMLPMVTIAVKDLPMVTLAADRLAWSRGLWRGGDTTTGRPAWTRSWWSTISFVQEGRGGYAGQMWMWRGGRRIRCVEWLGGGGMHKTGFAYNWRLLNANLLLFKPKALGNQEELLQSVLTDVKPPMQVLNYLAKRWCKQRLQSSHGGELTKPPSICFYYINLTFYQNRPKSDISGALGPKKNNAMASGDGTKCKT